jgi:hypothetical protein
MFIPKLILYKGNQKMTIKQYKNPPNFFYNIFGKKAMVLQLKDI